MGERIRFRDRSDGCPIIDIEKTRYRLVTTVIRTLYAEIRNTPRRASSRTRSRIDQHGNYLLVIANRLPPISDHPWNSINRGREWNIVAGEVVSTIDKFSSTAWFNERLERNFTRIIVTRTITTRVFPKRAFCDSFESPLSSRFASGSYRSFIDHLLPEVYYSRWKFQKLKLMISKANTSKELWKSKFLYFVKCKRTVRFSLHAKRVINIWKIRITRDFWEIQFRDIITCLGKLESQL